MAKKNKQADKQGKQRRAEKRARRSKDRARSGGGGGGSKWGAGRSGGVEATYGRMLVLAMGVLFSAFGGFMFYGVSQEGGSVGLYILAALISLYGLAQLAVGLFAGKKLVDTFSDNSGDAGIAAMIVAFPAYLIIKAIRR